MVVLGRGWWEFNLLCLLCCCSINVHSKSATTEMVALETGRQDLRTTLSINDEVYVLHSKGKSNFGRLYQLQRRWVTSWAVIVKKGKV